MSGFSIEQIVINSWVFNKYEWKDEDLKYYINLQLQKKCYKVHGWYDWYEFIENWWELIEF